MGKGRMLGTVYKYASKLRKGQKVLIEGRFRADTFTQEGKERQGYTNVARSILLLAQSDDSEIEGVSTNPEMGAAADEDDQSHDI
jgi:single-stranded DNA-binding protein